LDTQQNKISSDTTGSKVVEKGNKVDPVSKSFMIGSWIGEMGGKKFILQVDSVSGNQISGFNISGKTRRPVKGTFKTNLESSDGSSESYVVELKEPGDDKWDGVFNLIFFGDLPLIQSPDGSGPPTTGKGPSKPNRAEGEWKSNNGKLKYKLDLKFRETSSNPNGSDNYDGKYQNSNGGVLTISNFNSNKGFKYSYVFTNEAAFKEGIIESKTTQTSGDAVFVGDKNSAKDNETESIVFKFNGSKIIFDLGNNLGMRYQGIHDNTFEKK